MKKYFDLGVWIFVFALAPFAFLFFLSQNALPGDLFYPAKRGMEDVLLAAASLNPATKASFHVDLASKRYSEAEKLLLARADAAGLSDFVAEIEDSTEALDAIDSEIERERLKRKIIENIENYQNKLSVVQAQVQGDKAQYPQPTIADTTTSTTTTSTTQQGTQPVQTTGGGNTSPANTSGGSQPTDGQQGGSAQPAQGQTGSSNTTTGGSTTAPAVPTVPVQTGGSTQPPPIAVQPGGVVDVIGKTKDDLEKIKEKLKEDKGKKDEKEDNRDKSDDKEEPGDKGNKKGKNR